MVAVAVAVEEDILDLSMSASKSIIKFPTSTSGQLSLSSKSKVSGLLAAFLDFLGRLLLILAEDEVSLGLLALAAELTVTGGSSCIGRAKQSQLHGVAQITVVVPSFKSKTHTQTHTQISIRISMGKG